MRAVHSPTWSQNGRTQKLKACSAIPSKPLLQQAHSGMSALKFKPSRGNAFCASRQVNENSELFKKLDPGAQFQWERISSAVQPCRSLRGSEAELTTGSRYNSFWGRERLLDPGSLRRVARHSWTNGISLIGLRRPSAFEFDLRRGKILIAFRLHTASPDKIGLNMQVFQRASGSLNQAYPDPHCVYVECRPVNGLSAFDLSRVIWWGIVEAPADGP